MTPPTIPLITTIGNATLTLTNTTKNPPGLVPNEMLAVKAYDKGLLRRAAALQVGHTLEDSNTAVGLASSASSQTAHHLRCQGAA